MMICARVISGTGVGFINSVGHHLNRDFFANVMVLDHSCVGLGTSKITQQRFILRPRVLCQLRRYRYRLLAGLRPA
jgi:hypothetical protein